MFSKRVLELAKLTSLFEYSLERRLVTEEKALEAIHSLLFRNVGTIYVVGNGGSSGIASHFSCDLIRTLSLRSHTLFDSNLMTCFSNDFGYEEVFSAPLRQLLRQEDMLVAISSSGSSPNIVSAAEVASEKGCSVVTLSGFSADNPLRSLGDWNVWVPSNEYGLVESAHFFILHTIVDTFKMAMSHES